MDSEYQRVLVQALIRLKVLKVDNVFDMSYYRSYYTTYSYSDEDSYDTDGDDYIDRRGDDYIGSDEDELQEKDVELGLGNSGLRAGEGSGQKGHEEPAKIAGEHQTKTEDVAKQGEPEAQFRLRLEDSRTECSTSSFSRPCEVEEQDGSDLDPHETGTEWSTSSFSHPYGKIPGAWDSWEDDGYILSENDEAEDDDCIGFAEQDRGLPHSASRFPDAHLLQIPILKSW